MTALAATTAATHPAGVLSATDWERIEEQWERLSWSARQQALARQRADMRTLTQESAYLRNRVTRQRRTLSTLDDELSALRKTRDALAAEAQQLRRKVERSAGINALVDLFATNPSAFDARARLALAVAEASTYTRERRTA